MLAWLDYVLFQVFPYIAFAVFVLGCALRFDRDPYSWRTKSSQLLRRRQLVMGSALFHVGILVVLVGHIVGLFTPIAIFDALGISHGFKQVMAIVIGGIAGVMCLVGLVMLLHRRLTDPRIRATSSFADISILSLLCVQLLLGLATIPVSLGHLDGGQMVKFMEWAQRLATFRPAYSYVADASLIFKLHLVLGLSILLLVPFTRLVHALSAPLAYVIRPYQVVRKRAI